MVQIDMKLEVAVLGVADVDRAKAFYENLGWRLDADFATGDTWRVVQLTPHHSDASIIFGKGIASPKPGLLMARHDAIVIGSGQAGNPHHGRPHCYLCRLHRPPAGPRRP